MGFQKYTIIFINFLIFKTSLSSVITQNRIRETWMLDNIRVKRQEGYVYNKPSVAFDLPTQPSTAATASPSSGNMQTQYMYYAYPAPNVSLNGGGDTVNIGYSTTGTTTAPSASSSTAAANVQVSSSSSGVTGYNYGTPSSVSTGSQGVSCTSGYNCNEVSLNGPTQVTGSISTNAPKYLPPTSNGETSTDTGVSVNIPSGGGTSTNTGLSINIPSGPGSTNSVSVQPGSNAVDSGYLPPSSPSPTLGASPGPSIGSQSNPSVTPVTPNGYLPPISTSGSGTVSPVPTAGSATANPVSTPASTYLPPVI